MTVAYALFIFICGGISFSGAMLFGMMLYRDFGEKKP